MAPTRDDLVVTKLGKRYGRHRALTQVTATFSPGQISTILGPNGAGKSTLVAILSTLTAPSEGSVTWRGEPLHPGSPARAAIGYAGHDSGLYAELSARANLTLFARLYGLVTTDAAITALLERVGLTSALEGNAESPVRTFSRGMQQRLSLARALLHEPALLLFDEPSAALDPAGATWLGERLREERARGHIIVLVTHDLGLASVLSDQILFLRHGRLAGTHTPRSPLDEAALRTMYQELIGAAA